MGKFNKKCPFHILRGGACGAAKKPKLSLLITGTSSLAILPPLLGGLGPIKGVKYLFCILAKVLWSSTRSHGRFEPIAFYDLCGPLLGSQRSPARPNRHTNAWAANGIPTKEKSWAPHSPGVQEQNREHSKGIEEEHRTCS